jgi:hypothetical protein
MFKKYGFFLLISLPFFLVSCLNEEGQGGISVVQGKIFKVLHPNNNFSLEADTFPAAKENVYIVYGDEPIYGDKMETGYDGFYRFKYLTKGTYKVYAYSTLPNTIKSAVIDTVTVDYGKTVDVPNIYIHEGKSLETSYVKGTVQVRYYDKGFITAYMPAYETRVYIRHKGEIYHFDEVRTSLDGLFMFQGLSPGEYEVFVMTEQAAEQILTPVIQSVTITNKGEIVTIPNPFLIIINA